MNGMNFKTFISKVLSSLSDKELKDLADLMNSHSNEFINRSLVAGNLTTDDKGVSLCTMQLDPQTIRTGYLLYSDTYCVLLSYVSNSERVVEYNINVTNNTYEVVKEYLTTDYLRHEVNLKAIEKGELIDVGVEDINSGSQSAGKIIVSDGEGGATWEGSDTVVDLLAGEDVSVADLTSTGNVAISGNVDVTGHIHGDEIIETMNGYSYTPTENTGITYKYIGICKNGNKLTLVVFGTFTKTDEANPFNLGYFLIPNAVADKITTFSLGDFTNVVDVKLIPFYTSLSNYINVNMALRKNNPNQFLVSIRNPSSLTAGEYLFRYEATFLLSDSLAS